MKKIIAIITVVVALSATATSAYAMPKTDPVEVVVDENGTREIVTITRFEPRLYCWGVFTTPDERRIMFNDGSVGYILTKKGKYIWCPADNAPEYYYDVAEFVEAIAFYAWCRYDQDIDGAPIATQRGEDYTYFIFGVEDYIQIFERLYGVQ